MNLINSNQNPDKIFQIKFDKLILNFLWKNKILRTIKKNVEGKRGIVVIDLIKIT